MSVYDVINLKKKLSSFKLAVIAITPIREEKFAFYVCSCIPLVNEWTSWKLPHALAGGFTRFIRNFRWFISIPTADTYKTKSTSNILVYSMDLFRHCNVQVSLSLIHTSFGCKLWLIYGNIQPAYTVDCFIGTTIRLHIP